MNGDSDRAEHRSPDGRWRLLSWIDHDDRTGPWQYVRLTAAGDPAPLFELSSLRSLDEVTFGPGADELTIGGRDGWNRPWRALIDIADRSFRLHPHDRPEPLPDLMAALQRVPERPEAPPAVPTFGQRAMRWLTIVGCAIFVGGGVWMLLAPRQPDDRLHGSLGVVLFGGILWLEVREWRQQRAAQRRWQQRRR